MTVQVYHYKYFLQILIFFKLLFSRGLLQITTNITVCVLPFPFFSSGKRESKNFGICIKFQIYFFLTNYSTKTRERVQTLATMVGWKRNILKSTGLNVLKQSHKKRNLDKNIYDPKSHIWSYFSENIISGIQIVYISSQVLVDIIRVFFNFRFSNRKPQSQQKLLKKITHFTI